MTDGHPTAPIVAVPRARPAAPIVEVPRGRPADRRTVPTRLLVACIAGAAGVALLIIGTFLPWVTSGGVGRNIYALTGVAGKLGLFDTGSARAIPTTVGLLGPACLVPVVLALLRLRRTAAVVAIVVGGLGALLGIAALLAGGRAGALGIHPDPSGPAVLLCGGLLLLGAGIIALTGRSGRVQGHVPGTATPNGALLPSSSGRLDETIGVDRTSD